MLALSDVNIQSFIPIFANTGVPVAFLVPTPTGFGKSIMDATAPLRELFLSEGIHDYALQSQGPANKKLVKTFLVHEDHLEETEASLYRPVTKKGDPRIWIYHLRDYCVPCNLLAIIAISGELYVFNLSNPIIASSLMNHGFASEVLGRYNEEARSIVDELLGKLRAIHAQGFIPSITKGDPGVGDTLEHALGINRNNSKDPDYKGIELKTSRLSRAGKKRNQTRTTLFTKVPDEGMTYHEILENYGKMQIPSGSTIPRWQLYETFRCSRPNAYDLILDVDDSDDRLLIEYCNNAKRSYVSGWLLSGLKTTLLHKHHETFWIKAESKLINNWEYFRYDKVLHTKNPNVSLVSPLLSSDVITVDLAAHIEPSGKYRDHGVLFKIYQSDLKLLLGEPEEYTL